jgi:sulfide dehydrogenase cytochrome subunit
MKLSVVLLAASLGLAGTLHAKTLEENVVFCEECHGPGGISEESDVPNMAGLSDIAISDILMVYRDGSRTAISSKFRYGDTSRPETNMNEIAEKLSDEEIEALAVYYSEKEWQPVSQPFDAELAKKGAKIHKVQCAKCHEDGGSSRDDDVGILAGQWTPYLRTALTNFRNDKRETEPKMLKLVKKLSDDEIEALLNYWASQQ